MIRRVLPLSALALAAGCVPNNAVLTEGDFAVFLSHSTSLTVQRGKADLEATDTWWNIDCRDLADNQTALEGAMDICDDASMWPPTHEAWMSRDGYHIQSEDMEPWRGEAIMTSEGDLQVSFHHRVTGGDDMRFAFVLDPTFQPRTCVETESGDDVEWKDVDGDWLSAWSDPTWTDFGPDSSSAGHVFFLNANSYQFDPAALDEYWSLPLEWQAGYADAKFGDERFVLRSTRYGEPSFYTSYESEEEDTAARTDLFYAELEEGVPAEEQEAFQAMCDRVGVVADEVAEEYEYIDGPDVIDFRPAVHCNGWREPDGRPSGLDGWVELHYNWVVLDQAPETLAVGEPVSGEFNLVFDGEQTQSRFMVKGTFEVDKVNKDKWTTDDIESIKFEEHGTVLCGESYAEE